MFKRFFASKENSEKRTSFNRSEEKTTRMVQVAATIDDKITLAERKYIVLLVSIAIEL